MGDKQTKLVLRRGQIQAIAAFPPNLFSVIKGCVPDQTIKIKTTVALTLRSGPGYVGLITAQILWVSRDTPPAIILKIYTNFSDR